MARGPKKHLKRINAPHHWMLDKMGGIWAPRPSTGPHKLRQCLPVILILRERLKYALNSREVLTICKNKLVKVDGKVRTDPRFPAGFMDVVTLEKAKESFRLLHDTKGRYVLHRLDKEEAKFKLCKVVSSRTGTKKVPMITTHDGRTIRYPDPVIKVDDTIKLDLESGKITKVLKFEVGNLVAITKGRNCGRIGTLVSRDRHPGSFDIIYVKDSTGHTFATRMSSAFVIGEGNRPVISLPKGKGVKLSIIEERAARMKGQK
mmetsp:Transcript_16309/g.18470  ORF Transcript_16309/g.18470 Transcript_16309/m.18470 type:complete len:261 (+) Transcript_16309:158-940(+)